MSVPEHLLESHRHDKEGYRPLVDYQAWRVAVLNHIDELEPENLREMQRHDETDEVFVLLAGRCILFLGEGGETVESIHAVDLAPGTIYNVRRGAWHTHTLSRNGAVLVVENRDTSAQNSPATPLTTAQTAEIVARTRDLWVRTDA